MLDKPERTRELMDVLDAAVPFEVALMPDLIEHLARQQNPVAIKSVETVSKVSYLGDVGGIICHIQPEGPRARSWSRLPTCACAPCSTSRRPCSTIRSTA